MNRALCRTLCFSASRLLRSQPVRTLTSASMSQQQPRGAGHRGRGRGRGRGGNRHFTNGPRPTGQASVVPGDRAPVQASNDAMDVDGEAASDTDTSHLSNVAFASLAGKIDASILSTIPYSHMSVVQSATFDSIMSGVDVLARAKTGTGKTIAFLLPAIQSLLREPPTPSRPGHVSVLILSPTRELALQIEKEAKMLLSAKGGVIGVQHCIGGTNIKAEKTALQGKCDILVATPGRLLGHIEESNLKPQLSKVRVLILDEADRMLDMGFRAELQKIMSHLPPRSVQRRQTLLFSATVPEGIRDTADLDRNCVFINTLKEGEENTHKHVPQQYLIVPWAETFAATIAVLEKCFKEDPKHCKVMIFFTTARMTGLFYEMLTALKSQSAKGDILNAVPVSQIHSRMQQGARMRVAKDFGEASSAILCSSDVTARGMSFPKVTQVLQIGIPQNSDQYIHRLGRTARAGAAGSGTLMLNEAEKFFLQDREMRTLPINEGKLDHSQVEACRARVDRAFQQVPDKEKARTYSASLGFYKQFLKSLRWKPEDLVREHNHLAKVGMLYSNGVSAQPPPVPAKAIGKMGLKGTAGLNVVKVLPWDEEDAPAANKRRFPEGESRGQQGGRPRRG